MSANNESVSLSEFLDVAARELGIKPLDDDHKRILIKMFESDPNITCINDADELFGIPRECLDVKVHMTHLDNWKAKPLTILIHPVKRKIHDATQKFYQELKYPDEVLGNLRQSVDKAILHFMANGKYDRYAPYKVIIESITELME